MRTTDGLEFINRGEELSFLIQCLAAAKARPALILLRSPSGYGKSGLTDKLASAEGCPGRIFCIVDPSIRGRTGSAVLYDGFFLQRTAESLNDMCHSSGVLWPSLAEFLRGRRIKAISAKDPIEIVSEFPSLERIYKLAFEYASRAFSFGNFSSDKLFQSDQADAIAICSSYCDFIVKNYNVCMIIREAHHIDLQSLRTFLDFSARHPGPDLIFEYTSSNGICEPEHDKLFLRAGLERKGIDILELARLDRDHLEFLLKLSVRDDFILSSNYYMKWDGNIRSVIELRFQVSVGKSQLSESLENICLTDLSSTLIDHIGRTNSLERLILAIILVHIEAINRPTLLSALARLAPHSSHTQVEKALRQLDDEHAFVSCSNGTFRIQNETVALAIRQMAPMTSMLALAERALRDHYRELLEGTQYCVPGFSNSVRQYFHLCASSRDFIGLEKAVDRLTVEIRHATDQSIYIESVVSAVESSPKQFVEGIDGLVVWAASLAYEICDWSRVLKLIGGLQEHDAFTKIMKACALQEIGGHDEALELALHLRDTSSRLDVKLAARLIEVLVIGCSGRQDDARRILLSIIEDSKLGNSPLVGYAYRFFEIVEGFNDALPRLQKSIECFQRHSLFKSKAYSQLPAAVLLARSGRIDEARELIREARSALSGELRDQYMLLNNACAVDLLSDAPDFQSCIGQLGYALRLARDDFSELTIITNLGIAYLGNSSIKEAVECAEKCMAILENHAFADEDIYWPVCFNASTIFAAASDRERQQLAFRYPTENARPRSDAKTYWAFRFGSTSDVDEDFRFLASRRWHPVYLSHWIIDMEGLKLLKTE